jgi:hypothetical protein
MRSKVGGAQPTPAVCHTDVHVAAGLTSPAKELLDFDFQAPGQIESIRWSTYEDASDSSSALCFLFRRSR